MSESVKTRFAPSPTGDLHIGGIRTALFSFAMAASSPKGSFVLRIEDTDKKREIPGSKEKIKSILKELGLNWDEYFVQSDRVKEGKYEIFAKKLVKNGHAFYCNCKPKNIKKSGFSKILRDPCRDKNLSSGAIKLKIPDNEKISFRDFVIDKEISWDTSTLKDPVLLKSDGFPTYHLAVVVDDWEMGITHVLRGYDWLPSTPIHLLVYKFLKLTPPKIGHLTDILDPDGGKLSKRKGSVSYNAMKKEGYLPEAILNFAMLLGWAPKDNREFFTLEEFVKAFDKKGLQKTNPVFNRDKLDWFNSQYIQKLSDKKLSERLKPFAPEGLSEKVLVQIAPLIKTRIKKLSETGSLTKFFVSAPSTNPKLFGPNYINHLKAAQKALENTTTWTLDEINNSLLSVIESQDFKTGKFFMDLRIAITGQKITPPINDSIVILGKKETLRRIKKALNQ